MQQTPSETALSPRLRFWLVAAMVLAAILLRLIAVLPLSEHHPDEFGQYLEQAHRLVFGYGIVPWEYRQEMRNWLLPLFLSGPMAVGSAIDPKSMLYLVLPKLLVSMCSLPILWAAYTLGRRRSTLHAMIALFVSAIWFEFVYFAAHTLTEPLSVAAILSAAALLQAKAPNRWHLVLAGFLLGLGVVLRFHYAVPAAMIGLGSMWGFWRARSLSVIIGGMSALACSGVVDVWSGMLPFEWVFNNIHQNIVLNRAAEFGETGPFTYFGEWTRYWQGARPFLLLCLLPGIRHQRLLFWAAITTLAMHSFIGHKEYRFIFLTTSIFVIIAAIGTAEMLKWIAVRASPALSRVLPLTLVVAWACTSLALAGMEPMRGKWTQYASTMTLFAQAGKIPATCGVAVEFADFWSSGSYSILHRNVPIYLESALDPATMAKGASLRAAPAYNSLIAPDTLAPRLPDGYAAIQCLPVGMERDLDAYRAGATKVCLFHRQGACHGAGLEQYRVDQVLKQLNR